MGMKRPLDNEVQEFRFKQSRQLDYSNTLTQFDEVVQSHKFPQKPGVAGDMGDYCQFEWEEKFEDDLSDEDVDHADEDFETGAPFSWIATSSGEEDSSSGATSHSYLSQEYFESDTPRRIFDPVDDVYYCLMDRSPRKQVPVGPNHQANIPLWSRCIKEVKLDLSGSTQPNNIIDVDEEEKPMGKCIIPLPYSKIPGIEDHRPGEGRKGCLCVDRGSIRCIRQHILENKEELIETIGCENFLKLGFCEMGEEVTHKWSGEEEDLFHEVVYSNPVSLGRNFWKHLKMAFPSRTKKEFVSYYFNVFILRRRAVQNRSKSLDIDSDDDDWHTSYEESCQLQVLEEDEDSAVESPCHHDTEADHERGCTLADEDDKEEDDGDDSEAYVGDCSTDGAKEDASDDKISGHIEDDSCTSCEFHCNMVDYSNSVVAGSTILAMEEKTDLGKCWVNNLDGSSDLVNQLYIYETFDTRFPTASAKGVDFLPTSNIIEEIFGQEAWDDLTKTK